MFCSTSWKWTLAGPTICPCSYWVTLFWETLEISLPFRTWRHQALGQEVRAPRLLTFKNFFIEFGDLSIFEWNLEARSTAIDTSISGKGYSIASLNINVTSRGGNFTSRGRIKYAGVSPCVYLFLKCHEAQNSPRHSSESSTSISTVKERQHQKSRGKHGFGNMVNFYGSVDKAALYSP